MNTQPALNVHVTVALRMSATIAARKLGKAHAEAWWPEQQGFDLAHLAIPAAQRDISAYNRDALAFPKVVATDMEAATKFYGEVFCEEYGKAYARFSQKQEPCTCEACVADQQSMSKQEVVWEEELFEGKDTPDDDIVSMPIGELKFGS